MRAVSMQQVTDWLEKLGLGQYAQRFAENDISFSVLPDLTDQDLKEIGVLARSSASTAARDSRTHQPRERCSEGFGPARPRAPRHRRAPPSHGDVLGPRRFDGALGAHGP